MFHKILKIFVLAVLIAVLVPAPARAQVIYPAITGVSPKHPVLGQYMTIYGSGFLTSEACAASSLQVWFVSQQNGVNIVAANAPGVIWNADVIQLRVPANLVRGETYRVTVLRCNLNSAATPFYITVSHKPPKG